MTKNWEQRQGFILGLRKLLYNLVLNDTHKGWHFQTGLVTFAQSGPACHEPPMVAHDRQGLLLVDWIEGERKQARWVLPKS